MKTSFSLLMAAAIGVAAGCTQDETPAQAQRDADADASEHETDNTGRNARDREGENVTPFDQSNDEEDTRITREIRQSITEDDLSFNADNVKVVTTDRVVTLRGPVDSNEEKLAIEGKAKAVAGVARVISELETVRR
jgi:hyperosmotically inducible periplasmic protein